MTDQELLHSDDRKAWNLLFRRFEAYVIRCCMVDDQRQPDIEQDTWMNIYLNRHRFTYGALPTWIGLQARWARYAFLKSLRVKYIEFDANQYDEPNPEEELSQWHEELKKLRALLDKKPAPATVTKLEPLEALSMTRRDRDIHTVLNAAISFKADKAQAPGKLTNQQKYLLFLLNNTARQPAEIKFNIQPVSVEYSLLTERQRDVIILSIYKPMTEVAAIMKMSYTNAVTTAFQARNKISKFLKVA